MKIDYNPVSRSFVYTNSFNQKEIVHESRFYDNLCLSRLVQKGNPLSKSIRNLQIETIDFSDTFSAQKKPRLRIFTE